MSSNTAASTELATARTETSNPSPCSGESGKNHRGRTPERSGAPLARPDRNPFPIDPHTSMGRLIEAFEEVLDLGVHLSSLMALAAGSTVEISAKCGNAAVCLTQSPTEI